MATHPFLSKHWIIMAREIHAEFRGRVDQPSETLRLNVTVINAPFTDTEVLGHIDTTNGSIVPDEGHVDEADVAVTLPYALARELLVNPQPENVMIAFMSGEIEVQGDITLMMSLQDIEASPEQQALAEEVVGRLTDITD